MFVTFLDGFFFSQPLNLILLNDFDVFMGKKKSSNDAHGEINDLTQFPLDFYTFNQFFNGNCMQLVLALSLSLFKF